MKIVLVNNTFFPYQRGGAEVIVRRLAEDWSAAGHQVIVVALRPKKKQISNNEEYTPKGYQVKYWPSRYYDLDRYSFVRKLFWHLPDWLGARYLIKWRNFLYRFKPDLVVANNLTGLGFGLHFYCQRLNIASVQILHDVQYILPSGLLKIGEEAVLSSWPTRVYQAITARWFKASQLLISPSKWLMNCYRQAGWLPQARWQQITNPINLRLATEYRLADQLRRAIFIGQLTEVKGILWLADQWIDFNRQLITAGFNEVDLLIIGDGPLKDHLQLLASQDRRITLLGRLTSEQVAEQLALADVLLVPSFCYENWPTVLLEAASVGCSAIVSSHGGGGELAEQLGYLTFTVGDLDNLLNVWQKLAMTAAKIKTWPAGKIDLVNSQDYLQKILVAINKLD